MPVPHFNLPVLPGHSDGAFPGYVGDPLFEESSMKLWPGETQAFWLTVIIAPDCPARLRKIVVTADFGGDSGVPARRCEIVVDVRPITIEPSSRCDFAVTYWFYADALL